MTEGASIQTLLASAMRQHIDGDLAGAEILYRDILASTPDQAQARHYLGFLLQQTDRLPEAFAQLTQALALDDTHAEWHFNLGIVLARQAQPAAAIEAFTNAIALDPYQYFYWTNLGTAFEADHDDVRAEQCYTGATRINPDYPDAWYLLSALCLKRQRYDEARQFNYRGVVAAPKQSKSRILLSQAYHALGRTDDALAVFENWLQADPGNAEALHLLAAYKAEAAPAQCSSAYVEATFNGFARSFDIILGRLKYCGPQLVQDYLSSLALPAGQLAALDLGCGTGLIGEVIQPYTHKLIGIDLSQAMLEQATARACYSRLHKADIASYLQDCHEQFDLISCMDTFIYIGRLDKLLTLIYRQLKPGGRLLFSTEKSPAAAEQAWQLNTSGRYSHRHDDLMALLTQTGFTIEHVAEVQIRNESGYPIIGEFISTQRPANA
ncbi:tetratricopeptide repeat protein [Silvimonas sp.]|uniref:tetratricopeptide repeat protein n=1 Tax=Silvimonas sp. TaxID=2650811 RepID=UPI002841D4F2|nr:tetratricopeptide repeat protein [Silvimonas sp.]MDR3427080.1 tetratricopeptide repeat protein [Silvimonas sp.]